MDSSRVSRKRRRGRSGSLRPRKLFRGTSVRRTARRRVSRVGFSRKRFPRRRRSRRFIRSRKRFSRRGRGGKNSFRKKVIMALTNDQKFVMVYGSQHTVPAATVSGGPTGLYFTAEETLSGSAGVTRDTIDTPCLFFYDHMDAIFNQLWSSNTNTGSIPIPGSTGFNTMGLRTKVLLGGTVSYTLRAQSNETSFIDCYYVRARKDVQSQVGTSGSPNVYTFLARGFANNSLDNLNINPSTNDAMESRIYSPFQSYDFCKYFKIVKVKQIVIPPSEERTLRLTSKPRIVTPISYYFTRANIDGAQTFSTLARAYQYINRSQFILFRLHGRLSGIGTTQPNYSQAVSFTTPTVHLNTNFTYNARIVQHQSEIHAMYANFGITTTSTPKIIIPGGDVIGDEAEAK